MKKSKISLLKGSIIAFLFSVQFFSCTNPSAISSVDEITLRKTAATIEEEMEWTNALEPETLTCEIKTEGIEKNIRTDGRVVIATDESTFSTRSIYPSVKGFAPLDTTSLSEGARNTLNGFCDAIVSGKEASSYMDRESLYSLSFFLYDIKYDSEAEEKVFNRYLLGEPFMGELIQCPVRFFYSDSFKPKGKKAYSKKSYLAPSLDVFVYLVRKDDSWKVCQISYMEGK